MKYLRFFRMTVSVLFMMFFLTSCTAIGIDVESQMRPPKNNGEQELLQNALDAYISQTNVGKYSLKYPNEGQYLSAFILLDELQVPQYISQTPVEQENTATTDLGNFCVAFYRPDIENAKTHIHLLQYTDGSWCSISDLEGQGDTIAQVEFADLNGDAFPELLVGWSMYNTKDKRLFVYDLKNDLQLLSSTEIYTSIVVSDLTADGSDDLLLLTIEPTSSLLSARLVSYRAEGLFALGEVQIDSDILSIEHSLTAVFSENARGVFFDAYREPDTTVTELVLWENGLLWAPFYSAAFQMNTVTARENSLASQDIDEDGIVEWPLFSRLPEWDENEPYWKTSWYYYDQKNYSTVLDFESLVNTEDRYILKLTDSFPEEFTALYNKEHRVLELFALTADDYQPFLKIQTTASGKKADLLDDFVYFDESESLYYAVWYSKDFSFTMEEIRYLFSIL